MTLAVTNKHPLADCENCPWGPKGNFVPDSVGHNVDTSKRIPLLVIGEAPGSTEIQKKQSFIGPTGQLARTLLTKAGFNLNDVVFTNAVACHPSFAPGVQPSKPSPKAIAACRERVLDLGSRADKVLVMGNAAKESYLQTKAAISEVRKGKPKNPRDFKKLDQLELVPEDQVIIPTFHPAAAIRSADYFPDIVADILKFNKKYNWEDPEYGAFDQLSDCDDALLLLRDIHENKYAVAVDIETAVDKEKSFTHPDKWLSISLAYRDNKGELWALVVGGDLLFHIDILEILRRILLDNHTIYHNGKFDVQVLMRLGVIDYPRLSDDTMLGNYVLDERPGHHGLKGLSSELLGAPDYDSDIKPYTRGKKGNYGNIPKSMLYKYNAFDTICTYLIWEYQQPRIKKNRTYPRLLQQSSELIDIELDGICVDLDYLDQIDDQYAGMIQQCAEELVEYYPLPLSGNPLDKNPKSVPQTMAAAKALKITTMTDTAAATIKRALALAEPGSDQYRFLSLLLEHRRLNKLYGTYISGTRKKMVDGRVYPTFLQHGTVFGRLSSRNPNIQNVPRGSTIRKLFVPSDGNVFVQCDYSQVELRVICCEAKDEYLQGVFMDPSRDIHGEVSDRLYGPGNWTKEDRVRAKVYVFGSIYGLEPYSIGLAYGIPESQADKEQREFFSLIPDTMAWRQRVLDTVYKQQYLETFWGRRRRFPLITKMNKASVGKEALAFLPQSTANDICLESMVALNHNFRIWPESVRPRIKILVHDSIMVECQEEYRDDVISIMIEIMERVPMEKYSTYAPFAVSAEIGHSWGELKEIA